MGVQTPLTLTQAQSLFASFEITSIFPTSDGVMDTTYLTKKYILKYFERNIKSKIATEREILSQLKLDGCNTPHYLASEQGWYLYSRLEGKSPKSISYFHIQALARFLSKLHSMKFKGSDQFLAQYPLKILLNSIKKDHFSYYKKLQSLQNFTLKDDGFIHGDIFKDNTLFNGEKLAVFDFIDGGVGAFSFDIAVVLLAFNPSKRKSYNKLFLNTYNQHSPEKISFQTLQEEIKNAAKLYALLRIVKHKNRKKAQEFLPFL